jgi:hypothetical protein
LSQIETILAENPYLKALFAGEPLVPIWNKRILPKTLCLREFSRPSPHACPKLGQTLPESAAARPPKPFVQKDLAKTSCFGTLLAMPFS